MKYLDYAVRFIVGGLFIFSGLIKLNDPIGTEIKLEEYFEVFSTDFAQFFHAFIPASLELGMILIILEVVLGVAVLINYQMNKTSWALLLLIGFFTFLTFYSAYFNKVTDCGCFGDAIPLTPWQSFIKDIILVVLIAFLFARRKLYKSLFSDRVGNMVTGVVTFLSLIVGIYAIKHLPYIDFRPYAVGDNIPFNMIPEEEPIFEYTFEKDGESVKSQQYLLEKDGYTYVGHAVTNADKTIPKITDYNLWNEQYGDYTQQSFTGTRLMLISYNVQIASVETMDEVAQLFTEADAFSKPLALTSSDGPSFEAFRHEHQLAFPYFFADATVLKAMIRSNPGIMLVRNGTVLGKWHINDIPSSQDLQNLL